MRTYWLKPRYRWNVVTGEVMGMGWAAVHQHLRETRLRLGEYETHLAAQLAASILEIYQVNGAALCCEIERA